MADQQTQAQGISLGSSPISQAVKPQQKKKLQPMPSDAEIAELSNQLSAINRNIRVVEERYINLRKKSTIIEQNMLNDYKKMFAQGRNLSEGFMEIKKEISDINEKLVLLQKELENCAKKEDVRLVEKYISLWEPVNFIKKEEADKIIKRVIDERKKDKL